LNLVALEAITELEEEDAEKGCLYLIINCFFSDTKLSVYCLSYRNLFENLIILHIFIRINSFLFGDNVSPRYYRDGVSLCRNALVTSTVVPISGKRLIKIPKLFLYSFEKGYGQKLGRVLNHWSLPVYRENRLNLKLSVSRSLVII
jgi:hypothetical protein